MTSVSLSKDIEDQIRLKNKTQPYTAYKRVISQRAMNTGLERKDAKRIPKQMF
jgi:hypothetical protein